MKTILQALKDEVNNALLDDGLFENKLLARGIDPQYEICSDFLNSKEFKGAVADCLYHSITVPNFSESDISVSISDRSLILRRANQLYEEIGETPKSISSPKVFIGG